MHLKVLIIEDSEDDAMLLARYLKKCGFDPKWQRVDSEDGLAEAVEDRRWDVVLCDLSMPQLSPFMALDCVRHINPDIPIIIVTGCAMEDAAARLIQYGVQDVVLKDDVTRLKTVIKRELVLAQNRREKASAELRLAIAIETLSQGVALFDADARLMTCNKRYKLTMDLCQDIIAPGVFYGDLLRLAVERGQFAMSNDAASETMKRVLAIENCNGGQPFCVPYHDGRWIETQRHRTDDGEIVTTTTDVTEKKRREEALIKQASALAKINDDLIQEIRSREAIEEALRESQNRAMAIFESAVDGVITFDEDRSIETVNPAAEAIFRYSADELKGTHIHHLMLLGGGEAGPVKGGSRFPDQIEPRNASPRLVTGWRKNGESFPVELTISPVALRDRYIYTGIIRDVTERTKLDRMQREFVSVVSHELRTPLTAIKGSLALLNTRIAGDLPSRAKSMISIGLQNSDRLLRLIDDILDMEKIESGRIEFEFDAVVVDDLIKAAVEANRAYLDRFNVAIEIVPPDEPDVSVQGDSGRLMQVLANLFSNAAKYSPSGGTIVVGADVGSNAVRIWVRDEGPGIPESFQNRIFQKFSQADSSDTRQKGGTGLGLSIAKAIVENHRGTIDFETSERGATFFFTLPIQHLKAMPAAAGKPASLLPKNGLHRGI